MVHLIKLPTEKEQMLVNSKMKKLIRNRKNAQIKTIIRKEALSTMKDYRNSTLLHLAVFYKNIELVEYCISAKCDVNAQDDLKNTPLLIATSQLNSKLIKRLMDANANIFLVNQANECPLYMIFKNLANVPPKVFARFLKVMENSGRVDDIAQILVKSKCKLDVIVSLRNAEWTKAVIQRRKTINETESIDSIQQALDLMDVPNISALLHYGDDRENRKIHFFEKLMEFTENRNLEVVEILIKSIVNWSVWGSIRGYNLYAVRIMGRLFETANETTVNIFMQHYLHLRIEKGFNIDLMAHCGGNSDPGVIELLRQHLINKNPLPPVGIDKLSVLHFAVEKGVMENIDICLMKFGMDANLKDAAGRTPLFYACCSAPNVELDKRKEIAFKLLFYRGADPQTFDEYDLSLLNLYDPKNDWPVVQIVLQYLARLELLQPLHKLIRGIIKSNAQLNEYFEKCHEQLQNMKHYEFFGKVTIYSVIMQPVTVTARGARDNAVIELHKRENILIWDYFYRHDLCSSIDIIKNINVVKNRIASILYECLEMLRFNSLIITNIVDCLTYDDLRYFDSL